MFVRSNMDIPVRYSKSSGSVILKPNTVTYVDEAIVTAKELKDCYGDRIAILSNEIVEQIIEEEVVDTEIERLEGQDSKITDTDIISLKRQFHRRKFHKMFNQNFLRGPV